MVLYIFLPVVPYTLPVVSRSSFLTRRSLPVVPRSFYLALLHLAWFFHKVPVQYLVYVDLFHCLQLAFLCLAKFRE